METGSWYKYHLNIIWSKLLNNNNNNNKLQNITYRQN